MKFSNRGGILCEPQDEEAKGAVRALHAMLALQDPAFSESSGEVIAVETVNATNKLGFNFQTCAELTNNITDVIEMTGGTIIDPATGTPLKKTSGVPWGWMLLLGVGGVLAWNYTRPKDKRWF